MKPYLSAADTKLKLGNADKCIITSGSPVASQPFSMGCAVNREDSHGEGDSSQRMSSLEPIISQSICKPTCENRVLATTTIEKTMTTSAVQSPHSERVKFNTTEYV